MSTLTQLFSDIANAIRQKDGTIDTITPINFAERILTLPTTSSEYGIPIPCSLSDNILVPVVSEAILITLNPTT